MDEEFYAVVKLVSGEEIFGIVSPTNEQGVEYLIISDPIIITKLDLQDGYVGYKIEPWLKLTTETIYFIEKSKIITVIESFDDDLVTLYKTYLENPDNIGGSYSLDRSEGFVNNVKKFRNILEKLYRIN